MPRSSARLADAPIGGSPRQDGVIGRRGAHRCPRIASTRPRRRAVDGCRPTTHDVVRPTLGGSRDRWARRVGRRPACYRSSSEASLRLALIRGAVAQRRRAFQIHSAGQRRGPLRRRELLVGRRRVGGRAQLDEVLDRRSRWRAARRIHSPGGSTQSMVPSSKLHAAELVVVELQLARLLAPSRRPT